MSNWRVLSESQYEEFIQSSSWIFFYLNRQFVLFCHLILHHYTSAHKMNRDILGRQSNLVWSSGGTDTFNEMLVHWWFCCRLDLLNLTLEMWHSEEFFKGSNEYQYFCCLKPIKGSRGYQCWLEGHVHSLSNADRADYIVIILRCILKFF